MPVTDFRIKSLTFSGGQTMPLESGTLLLLVGPNNSGKSAALREIGTWLAAQNGVYSRLSSALSNSAESKLTVNSNTSDCRTT